MHYLRIFLYELVYIVGQYIWKYKHPWVICRVGKEADLRNMITFLFRLTVNIAVSFPTR